MKYILIWAWISLSTGQGFSVTMGFDSAESCLKKAKEIEQRTEFKDSKITCLSKRLS